MSNNDNTNFNKNLDKQIMEKKAQWIPPSFCHLWFWWIGHGSMSIVNLLWEAGCLKSFLLFLPSALFGYRSRIQRSGNCAPFKFPIPPPLCCFNGRVNCDCTPLEIWIMWNTFGHLPFTKWAIEQWAFLLGLSFLYLLLQDILCIYSDNILSIKI